MLPVWESAYAQKAAIDCENAMAQSDMTTCAWRAADKADAEMAQALAKARKAMEAYDRNAGPGVLYYNSAAEALELSQRGWSDYRKGECMFAGFAERGGSMEPMLVGQCMEDMARKRIAVLNELAEE